MKWRFIYRGLKARYRDQRLEISTLIKHLKPDEIALDIGANKGSYLWALSKAVSKGKVLAFEPQSKLSAYLKVACKLAGLHNVEVYTLGVSDTASTKTLAIPGGQETSPGASFEFAVKNREICKTEEVETITLDDFLANEQSHVGAIKIDVEGHEIAALSGAKKIIAKHQPIIICESEQRHLTGQTVNDLFELMKTIGYSGIFAYRGQILPTENFVPSVHQAEVGERFWNSADYCNNFIFRPKK